MGIRPRHLLLASWTATLCAALASCGSFTPATPRVRDTSLHADRVPPDFALSLTVLTPGGSRAPSAPEWLAPAWYVVEADGQLRVREGVRQLSTPLPPLARQLRHEDVRELWSTVRAGGLAAQDQEGLSDSVSVASGVAELPRNAIEKPVAAISISSGGQRRGYLVDLTTSDAASGRTRDLAARLAQLASVGRPR